MDPGFLPHFYIYSVSSAPFSSDSTTGFFPLHYVPSFLRICALTSLLLLCRFILIIIFSSLYKHLNNYVIELYTIPRCLSIIQQSAFTSTFDFQAFSNLCNFLPPSDTVVPYTKKPHLKSKKNKNKKGISFHIL